VLQVEKLLERVVKMDGSDLHLKTDTGKVYARVYSELSVMEDVPDFTQEEFDEAIAKLITPEQLERFHQDMELDFALEYCDQSAGDLDQAVDPAGFTHCCATSWSLRISR